MRPSRPQLETWPLPPLVLDALPVGVLLISKEGFVQRANGEARRILGLGEDELRTRPLAAWDAFCVHEDGTPYVTADLPVAKALTTGETSGPATIGVRHPSGSAVWVVACAMPTRGAGGEVEGAAVTFVDVTEQRRAEDAVRAAERRWSLLAESIPDVVAILDRDARIVWINRARPSGETLVGQQAYALLTPESVVAYREALAHVMDSGTSARIESRSLREGGGVGLWFETILVPLAEAEGGASERVLAVARDISERKQNEEDIRASEQRWRMLVDNLPDAVLVLDRELRILSASIPGAGGAEAVLIGKSVDVFLDEAMLAEFHGHVAKALETESSVRYEIRRVVGDGAPHWYDAILVPLKTGKSVDRFMVVTREVTTQRSMLATLAEKERLASVGMVAASVAHEVMNPLTYVLVNLDHALNKRHADDEGWRRALLEAREGAQRVKQIVADLRSLGRAGDEARLYVDVRSVLEIALRLSGPEVGRTARIDLQLDDVPGVFASESRLCQVFINLLTNAAQAMAGQPLDERELEVRTRYDEASSFVGVAIADSGVGIPRLLFTRIFEPFFTTKRDGTGLGLSISRDIVTRMGGRIDVESAEGRGTTFTVWLPATGARAPTA